MEYSGIMDGSGIDLDISQEIQVETTQADPGPPPASSTPAKPAKKDRGKTHLCTACGNTYKHLPNLRRHIRATHEEGFQCFICKKALVSQVALESHLNGHEKKKPFSCAACKKTYQSRTSLAQHSCSSKPQSFPCDECPKVCPSKKAEACTNARVSVPVLWRGVQVQTGKRSSCQKQMQGCPGNKNI